MKICVFSDSHGYANNMTAAIGLEQPDICFFLGDGARDLNVVMKQHPDLPVFAVRGNCDFSSDLSNSIVRTIAGVTIYAAHGHMDNVKYESALDTLTARALEAGADVALFGHTHRQHLSRNLGVLLINPGSIGRSYYPSYAVLNVNNGFCDADLKTI